MSVEAPWLHVVDEATLPAKARRLALLARSGIPVPRGLVVEPSPAVLDDESLAVAVDELLEAGPVVVRSALAGEDEAEGSAAGLGRSALGRTDVEGVRTALADLAAQRDDPWLVAYRSGTSADIRDRAIIQHEVPRRVLLVVAVPTEGEPEVEVHSSAGEALAEGRSPDFAGLLSRWPDPARSDVECLVARVVDLLPETEHGLDLEIVVPPEGSPQLVQARPLTAPLHPGWPPFRRALERDGHVDELRGILTLDAEHNPAPLSPAHAWLMSWLREQRPAAGDPTVLAGWLYVRTLPRDLARRSSSSSEPSPSALEVVAQLHAETLPHARARLRTLEARLGDVATSPQGIAPVLSPAQDAFLAMIDAYVGVLVPARTRARRATGNVLVADHARPLSVRGRDEYLDVLPATWDLASPSLADLGTRRTDDSWTLPTSEAEAATLLGEWDDHLFALGLAPLRAWFRAAGSYLGLDDDVFMLTAPEVAGALTGTTEALRRRIDERRELQRQRATLRPPLRIEDGRPVSFGRRARLRGVPIGPSFTGRLAPRHDLPALLADPPGPDAIVTLPSLTAPAAVALRQLGVRAVCCEHGGPLSHAALMTRELGLSALIGCRGCTELPAGRRARLDTTAGRLVLEPTNAD